MNIYRSREVNYAEIKHRAIALLQAGEIDGKTFDQIREGERLHQVVLHTFRS